MEDYVLFMGILNLALSFWILRLLRRNSQLEGCIEGAFLMLHDLSEGNAVIEKSDGGFKVVRKEKQV